MTTYILDTGILLGYVRGAGFAESAEKCFALMSPANVTVISSVSLGEIYSIALRLGWGNQKRSRLEDLLSKVPAIGIDHTQTLEMYAEIDVYSQGKHPAKKLPTGLTARNMGKNDVWIAATGAVLKATLLTTDRDFDHLNNVFLHVEYIDPSAK